jgi:hypothetical protein
MLVALGMSHSSVSRRCGPGGPWRRVIPGVVLLTNGRPTRRQLALSALVHAGPQAMITGVEAAWLHGLRHLPDDSRVHVLIPHERRAATRSFAVVERTIHLPRPVLIDGLPVAPLARSLIDAAHRMDRLAEIRAMITEAVGRRLVDPRELQTELDEGTTIGSALPRHVLGEMNRGVRAAVHGWASTAARRSKLPEPLWDVEVCDEFGTVLGVADGFWSDVGLAWQIDRSEFRLRTDNVAEIGRDGTRLAATGVVVVQTLPSQLKSDPMGVVAELRVAYERALGRPPPAVRPRLWRAAA